MNSFSSIHGGLLYLAGFALVVSTQPCAQQTAARRSSASNWVLTWSDEFSGPDGSAPDPTKWIVESGGNGWGNSEMQYYTPRRENVRQEKGSLVIEAIKEKFTGPDGDSAQLHVGASPDGRTIQPAVWSIRGADPNSIWARGVACVLVTGR